MSIPETEFTEKRARTYQGLVNAGSKKTTKGILGSLSYPLLTIPLDHVVIDELHLFLRIFDILLRNIVYMALKSDEEQGVVTNLGALKKPSESVGCLLLCGRTRRKAQILQVDITPRSRQETTYQGKHNL